MERRKPTGEYLKSNEVYASDILKDKILSSIQQKLPQNVRELSLVEAPPQTGYDYGVNLRAFGNPEVDLPNIDLVEETKVVGSFLNFKINMAEFGELALNQIIKMGSDFGKENEGKGRRVVIDMSSPNIAKRMSYAHLRSTVIGDSLANIYRSQGYDVIRDNHLGDWGTQFGKLMVAIKKWGNEQEILASDDPIGALQSLYVKFDREATDEKELLREKAKEIANRDGLYSVVGLEQAVEQVSQEIMKRKQIERNSLEMDKVIEDALDRVIESDLEKEGRSWFLKLEKGNPEARRLWKLCIDLSMKEFNQIYETLGVGFEETLGESFYEDQLQNVVNIVKESNVGKISEGALVLDMQDKGLGVAIVQKSDGASLYMTRDLACAIYRQEKMGIDKAIYVVGGEQKQYFQQLFEALRRLGYKIGENAEHVYFGMISLPEGKMSTRKGRTILLKDVISEGLKKASEILEVKNPELYKNELIRDTVVRQIAIGALKWNDLSQDAKKPIIFDWSKALNFEGNSAPYVQYTAVRANKILKTSGINIKELNKFEIKENIIYSNPLEKAVIRQLSEFPNTIREALKSNSPTRIATYVYELSKRFNSLYTKLPVLKAENKDLVESRLKIVATTSQVITNALGILGIEVPEKM